MRRPRAVRAGPLPPSEDRLQREHAPSVEVAATKHEVTRGERGTLESDAGRDSAIRQNERISTKIGKSENSYSCPLDEANLTCILGYGSG